VRSLSTAFGCCFQRLGDDGSDEEPGEEDEKGSEYEGSPDADYTRQDASRCGTHEICE